MLEQLNLLTPLLDNIFPYLVCLLEKKLCVGQRDRSLVPKNNSV